jgi:predicted Rossmann fold flavoprotein
MARSLVVIGGGAAGVFGAVRAAELDRDLTVTVLEKGRDVLQKVGISGGGRCNVTHDCRDPRALVRYYPRGERELRGMFARFAAQDTIDWFTGRGIALKTEDDGRMFPVTDDSATVIGALVDAARNAGVTIQTKRQARGAERVGDGFRVHLDDGDSLDADQLLITTGGMRGGGGREMIEGFGHGIVEPVPSLFTFHIDDGRLAELAGLSVPAAEVRVEGHKSLVNRGPVLITHWGLSGPGVLKLSALGARALAECDYQFTLLVNWVPEVTAEALAGLLQEARDRQPRKHVAATPLVALPRRLWERLVSGAGIPDDRVWTELRRDEARALVAQLIAGHYPVHGKSLNKDEFVTCGGVPLREVDLRRMESRKVPGLFMAGEVLDIDGVTGGFNLQAAWTGGWIAGGAVAGS